MQLRTQQCYRQPVSAGETDFRVAFEGGQAREVLLLLAALLFDQLVTRIARSACFRHGDDQHLAVIQRQPSLPLGVGEGLRARFQKGAKRRQAFGEIRITVFDEGQGRRLCPGAGHVADQMNHRIALPDVVIQLIQRLRAGRDEVLLYLDRDVGTVKIAAQSVTVAGELRADGGQEDADLGQGWFLWG